MCLLQGHYETTYLFLFSFLKLISKALDIVGNILAGIADNSFYLQNLVLTRYFSKNNSQEKNSAKFCLLNTIQSCLILSLD